MCHPSGWIQSDIFVQWLDHFISIVKPTKDDPVLLLLDGHATHTKNLPLMDKARHNGVIIVSFPPHSTHRLQPLDVSIMGPLSTFYSQEVATWLRNNPGRIVTQFQTGKLFGIAHAKAATLQNAMSGFLKTGICPLNKNIFSDHDFVSASTTDAIEPEAVAPNVSATIANVDTDRTKQHSDKDHAPGLSTAERSPQPSTSRNSAATTLTFSPADIMPKPHVVRKNVSSRRGKTAIITSSLYKSELEENDAKKSKKRVVSKLSISIANSKKKKDLDDNMCVYCEEIYGNTKSSDGWVQCLKCKKWVHESCTGCEAEELDEFHCFRC